MKAGIIDAEVLLRLTDIAHSFASAKPFRHVVIDNFLDSAFANKLLAEFPAHPDPDSLLNEFGDHNPKSAISDIASLGGAYAEFDAAVQGKDFITAISAVTGIENLCYDPHYFGAGIHENFHGAGLDAHVDFNIHPVSKQHRRLNAIVYLNKEWEPEWGGQICLHTNPYDGESDRVIEFAPVFNRCIIFETNEVSWHSVRSVEVPLSLRRNVSRKSITIYMYTDDRPKEELAVSHGTIYIQGWLPAHFKPGHKLTRNDIQLLQENFKRRNLYLKHLYKREYKFSDVIESLRRELAAATSRISIPVCGGAHHLRTIIPTFPDGWVGKTLEFYVKVTRPVNSVLLHVYRPPEHRWSLHGVIQVGHTIRPIAVKDVELSEVCIPLDEVSEGEVHIKLDFDNPSSGAGADVRELSLILGRIEFS